eukprot:TRINITY_DN8347_c0_g1_i1.p1 TRINITY_DN8347_c0_g1~~TRINITY_DN8347_c0_g1_i1.p1  ORF type:complete len:1167 (-),score=212.58 TRINITY_DN8347_c0_g1_i1:97-3597(-)
MAITPVRMAKRHWLATVLLVLVGVLLLSPGTHPVNPDTEVDPPRPAGADGHTEPDAAPSPVTVTNLPDMEADPLDYSLVLGGGLDGTIYALDGATGEIKWRFNSGGPLLASAQLQDDSTPQIIPSLDGTLFTFMEGEGLTQLPINARDVAEDSHFRATDGTVFLSSKDTKLYSLSAEKGTINYIRSPSAHTGGAHSYKADTYFNNDILIGRSDYHVRAIDEETGLERWNLTFGEYFVFDAIQEPRYQDKNYLDVSTDLEGKVRAHVPGAPDNPVWTKDVGSPLVVMFNITNNALLQLPTPFAEQLRNMARRKRFRPGLGPGHGGHQSSSGVQTSIGVGSHTPQPPAEAVHQVYIGSSRMSRRKDQLFAISYLETLPSFDHSSSPGTDLASSTTAGTGSSSSLAHLNGNGHQGWRPAWLPDTRTTKYTECPKEWDGGDSCILGVHPVEYKFDDPSHHLQAGQHHSRLPLGEGGGGTGHHGPPQLGHGEGAADRVQHHPHKRGSERRTYWDALADPATHITTLSIIGTVILLVYKFGVPGRANNDSSGKPVQVADGEKKADTATTSSSAGNTTTTTATTSMSTTTTTTSMSVDTGSLGLVPTHPRPNVSITSPLATPATPAMTFMSRYYSDFDELEKLGSGAFGTVFRVRNTLDGREYAMKKVRLPSDARTKQRVINEVKHLAKMDHKNVVRYHHAWVEALQPGKTMKEELGLSDSEDDVSVTVTSWSRDGGRRLYSDTDESDGTDSDGTGLRRRRRKTTGHDSDSSFSAGIRKLSTALQSDPYDDAEFMGRTLADCSWSGDDDVESSVFQSEDEAESRSAAGDRSKGSRSGGQRNRRPRPSEELEGSLAHASHAAPGAQNIMYIQMLLCTKTLKTWLRRDGRVVDKKENMYLFRQIVDGLCYVHELDLVHRDLNPANIFIEEGEQSVIRIGDFGLTKDHSVNAETGLLPGSLNIPGIDMSRDSSFVSMTGEAVGTPMYIAPEVKKRGSRSGNKVDIYSLGVIFFEFLHPFGTFAERHKVLSDLCTGIIPDAIMRQHERECLFVKWLMDPDPKKRPSARQILESALVNAYDSDANVGNPVLLTDRTPQHPHLRVHVQETPTVMGDVLSVIKDADLVITHSDTVHDTKNDLAVMTYRFDPPVPRGIDTVVETIADLPNVKDAIWCKHAK